MVLRSKNAIGLKHSLKEEKSDIKNSVGDLNKENLKKKKS